MEIRLVTEQEDEKTCIQLTDSLTLEEYEIAKKAIGNLFFYNENKKLLKIISLNCRDLAFCLEATVNEIIGKLTKKWNGLNAWDVDQLLIDINRNFLNYLSSIRTYLDHSETFIKRHFGKGSIEAEEFKEICSHCFDNSFAYRFFYKLRNYSQHCGLPLSHIAYTIKNDRVGGSKNIFINISFNKAELLKNFDGWGKVQYELNQELFELGFVPLFEEMETTINMLTSKVINIILRSVHPSATLLQELIQHLRSPYTKVSIFYDIVCDEKGRLKSFTSEPIPLHLVDEILKN